MTYTNFVPKETYNEYEPCDTLSDALLCIMSGNGEVDVVDIDTRYSYIHSVRYTYIVNNGVVVGRKFEHPIIRGSFKTYYY